MAYLKLRSPSPQEVGKNSIFMAVLDFLLTIRYLGGRVWKTDLLCQAAFFPTWCVPDLLKISGWLILQDLKSWKGLTPVWTGETLSILQATKDDGFCIPLVCLSAKCPEKCFVKIVSEGSWDKFNHPSIWKEN